MKQRVPILILVFGGILSLFGLMAGVTGYVNGGAMLFDVFEPEIFSTFSADIQEKLLYVGTSAASRNLAMALTMIFALIIRHPKILLTAFAMRAFTELQDAFSLLAGAGVYRGQQMMGVIFLGFVVLEIWCIYILWNMKDDSR